MRWFHVLDVVTFGETMVLFSAVTSGPMRHVPLFIKTIGGAESNLAIALARLGHRVGWFSRLGDDEFGKFIHFFVRGEGVDTSRVIFDPEAPTGVFFKERRTAGQMNITYYRRGSAASRLGPDDIDPDYIRAARILHVTGITPALSASARQAVFHAIDIARESGVMISFDPNIRLKLWSADEARPVLLELLSRCDVVMPGHEEGALLVGSDEPRVIATQLLERGAKVAIVKLGKDGAFYMTHETWGHVPGFSVPAVIDPVGAGDGFAAGVLSGILRGYSWADAVRLGNAVGAYITMVPGDVEGLPSFEEIQQFLQNGVHDVCR